MMMSRDMRKLDELTEDQLNQVIERELKTIPKADMRLKGNIIYMIELLEEILRRRKMRPV